MRRIRNPARATHPPGWVVACLARHREHDAVIARDERLRSNLDFERARLEGRSFQARMVVLIVRPNGLGRNRYGVAAGKRLGNAVQRNRAKRVLRETLRQEKGRIAQGYDLVLIARHALTPDVKQPQVAAQVAGLFDRAGLRVSEAEGERT